MVILVDLDNVLVNTGQAWVDTLNERHGTTVKYDDISKWDVEEFFPTLSCKEIYDPLESGEVWSRVSLIPGARETLDKLIAEEHEVFIVTASSMNTIGKKWREVIKKFLPMIHQDHIIVTHRKGMIKGDVLIDDAPFNFDGGDFFCILFDAPHNRAERSSGFVRVSNWDEAYEYIHGLEVVMQYEG